MVTSSLFYKVNKLRQNSVKVRKIENYITNVIELYGGEMSAASKEHLFVTIAYAFVRIGPWVGSQIFSACLIDYIKDHHHLSGGDASLLIKTLSIDLDKVMEIKKGERVEQDFLMYILTQSLRDHETENLVFDLGVGSKLLGYLREAVKEPSTANSLSFAPTLQMTFSKIMQSLSNQMRKTPWAINRLDLYFMLQESDLGFAIGENECDEILRRICNIELQPKKWAAGMSSKSTGDITGLFKALDLIYSVTPKEIALTRKGCQLSACYFFHNFYCRSPADYPWQDLPMDWQQYVFRFSAKDLSLSYLEECKQTPSLHSENLNILLQKGKEFGHGLKVLEIAKEYVQHGSNSLLKMTAQKFLQEYQSNA